MWRGERGCVYGRVCGSATARLNFKVGRKVMGEGGLLSYRSCSSERDCLALVSRLMK